MLKSLELLIIKGITKRLPNLKGMGVLGNFLARMYIRKKRPLVMSQVYSFSMMLNPHEMLDSHLLFMPHLYEAKEVAYLKRSLKPGDVFLDLGSNIGFYSLFASQCVGPTGKVVAIEAVPSTFEQLKENIDLNCLENINPVNVGLSDKEEQMEMYIPDQVGPLSASGSNSFMNKTGDKILIQCQPLFDVLQALNVFNISVMKIDVEGFEWRVLNSFFKSADPALHPKSIIVEYHSSYQEKGDVLSLLKQYGYSTVFKTRFQNYIMVKH